MLLAIGSLTVSARVLGAERLKLLIVDGQNNHEWQVTTPMMQRYFQESGRFEVEVATSPPARHDMSKFRPKFSDYDVVVSNYNGEPWSQAAQVDFQAYVFNGGGFVVVHAANNAFADWPEYNQMIGLGGWNSRDEKSGPYVYFREGAIVRDETAGRGGSHGSQHEFLVTLRNG
ncbi:MAG: ThuA domain-containing protein, partial [Planctomycetaceae bacterium]|nr:ThuA domain-containing protein [Planctomycetaceae bacterium]